MKKILLVIGFAIGLTSILSAQKNATSTSILNKSLSAIRNNSGLSANYAVTSTGRTTAGNVYGHIYLKRNKYYIQEGHNQIISNGVHVWNYDGGKEVMLSKAEHNGSLSAESIVTGNMSLQNFNYGKPSSQGSNYLITMTPTDKRLNFTKVQLYINKSSYLITKAKVTDKSKNTIIMTLSNVKRNQTIPDAKFTFDTKKHPGVKVVNN